MGLRAETQAETKQEKEQVTFLVNNEGDASQAGNREARYRYQGKKGTEVYREETSCAVQHFLSRKADAAPGDRRGNSELHIGDS